MASLSLDPGTVNLIPGDTPQAYRNFEEPVLLRKKTTVAQLIELPVLHFGLWNQGLGLTDWGVRCWAVRVSRSSRHHIRSRHGLAIVHGAIFFQINVEESPLQCHAHQKLKLER